MSLWADYLQERLGKFVLERESGFAVFSYVTWNNAPAVYIEEIYVAPDGREKKLASDMADEIAAMARECGVTVMLGSVAPNAKGATRSVKVLLSYGFDLASIDASRNLIMFTKVI